MGGRASGRWPLRSPSVDGSDDPAVPGLGPRDGARGAGRGQARRSESTRPRCGVPGLLPGAAPHRSVGFSYRSDGRAAGSRDRTRAHPAASAGIADPDRVVRRARGTEAQVSGVWTLIVVLALATVAIKASG